MSDRYVSTGNGHVETILLCLVFLVPLAVFMAKAPTRSSDGKNLKFEKGQYICMKIDDRRGMARRPGTTGF